MNSKMFLIYVVHHNLLEDCNIFFRDEASAKQKIIELAEETETDINEWNIRVFTEGEKFWADMSSY
jgi:hypothetical protein